MKEDKIYKDLPQVIDIEVEPDIDFELREPEDEGIEDSPIEIPSTTTIENDEIIDVVGSYTEEEDTPTEEKYTASAGDETYTEKEACKTKDKQTEQANKKVKKDTSFTTFKATQQAGEKKWRKKMWSKFKRFIWVILALLIGVPLLGFGGFFAVIGVGMAIFICAVAFGTGVLGLGASAFMTTAEIAGVGPVMFFMSLIGVGGGGLGLLLIWTIIIGLKNLIVKFYWYIRNKVTKEAA